MAISVDQFRLGASSHQQAGARTNDRPQAQFWVNTGYIVGEGDEARFVSLPGGTPLDTTPDVATKSSNEEYSNFQQARNALKAALIERAKKLAPGEAVIIGGTEGGLCIQLRRVTAEAAPTAPGNNPFIKSLSF